MAALADTVEDYAKKYCFESQFKQNILLALQGRSDGPFLRASLAWQHFVTVGTWSKATLQKRIARHQGLAKGSNKLCYCVLMFVDLESHGELYHILRWLLVARRHLSFEELSVALALNEQPQTSAEHQVHKRFVTETSFWRTTVPILLKSIITRGVSRWRTNHSRISPCKQKKLT